MAVTIKGITPIDPNARITEHPEVKLDQIEVFGRLRMSRKQIAEYYGLNTRQISYLFRRPELTAAYDRGRAETVVAIRQRQLQIALGSERVPANPTMLIHIGKTLGEFPKDGVQDEVEDFEPNRFSWDTELMGRVAAARDKIAKGAGDTTPETD